MPRKPRKQYSHKDIQGMLSNRQRASGAFSYLHPQISPTGQSFHEDDDALGIVSDAKRRYIKNGWMRNRKVSDAAGTKSDLTMLMSLEGALTPAIHNAIQGYPAFDPKIARLGAEAFRRLPPLAVEDDPRSEFEKWHDKARDSFAKSTRERRKSGGTSWGAHVKNYPKVVGKQAEKAGFGKQFQEYMDAPDPGDEKDDPEFTEEELHAAKVVHADAGAPKMTSMQESTEAKQEGVSPLEKADERPSGKPKRRTKKFLARQKCDECGIKYKKSWNTKRLESELSKQKV